MCCAPGLVPLCRSRVPFQGVARAKTPTKRTDVSRARAVPHEEARGSERSERRDDERLAPARARRVGVRVNGRPESEEPAPMDRSVVSEADKPIR
jgi:hypothetical protein